MDTDETTTGHGPSAADLPNPDDTLVIERPGSDASFGTYSDLRIIPVEIETTFAFGKSPADDDLVVPEDMLLEPLEPPEAVLLDAGDLDEVHELLLGLGVDVERIEAATAADLPPWPRPKQLLVASARLALSLPITPHRDGCDFAALAVSDGESRGFAKRIRELGFQYVVNRPIHQELLRLLLQQALFRGRHQRRALRYPVGRKVAWRRGTHRQQATLVELSAVGGRLHARFPAPVDAPVTLRVRESSAGRALTLRGRVVRCALREIADASKRFSLGVAWHLPTEVDRQELDRLLSAPGWRERAARQVAAKTAAPTPPKPDAGERPAPRRVVPSRPPRRPSELLLPNRRRDPRALLGREVVVLDPANHVCTTLVGRDVSPRGMLVETHPSLLPGQRVRVAVHTEAGREPIVLEAKVARNDGARGLVMRFVQMRDTHTEALVALVAALSPVEAVRSRQPIHHGNSAA